MIAVFQVYRIKRSRWFVEGPVPNLPMAVAELGPYRSRRKAFKAAQAAARAFVEMEGKEL